MIGIKMTTELEQLSAHAESNSFTPMTEVEMATIKGGTDIPPWLQDLIQQVGDLLDSLGNPAVDGQTSEDDFWDDFEEELNELGLEQPVDIDV